jgi:UDP-N-acetylglucosamine acyltransferase
MGIHPTAYIHPKAVLHDQVEVGPFACIGEHVTIDSGTVIGSHVVVKGKTKIGKDNHISPFVSVGGDPQTVAYAGELTMLEIGDRNTIHEYCTINRGCQQCGEGLTTIGDDNLFQAYVHVGHDCKINNHTVLVNNTTLGGHVQIDDYAILGAFTTVHQSCSIGQHAFLTRSCCAVHDVLPYLMVAHNPSVLRGLNKIGLKRRGFTAQDIAILEEAYRLVFRQRLLRKESIKALRALNAPALLDPWIQGIEDSQRGVVR